jgi:hypothetical protein
MSSPGPGHTSPSLLSLPDIVRDFIRDRYLAGVADAEAQYANAVGDEDSLTGALGALISTSIPREFRVGPVQIVVQIDYRKLRGRGNDAPEKLLGPDGIFQIQVSANGKPSFRKGLPFQAKKNWKGKNKDLVKQAEEMRRSVGGGIVIDYTPNGYSACEIEHVIESRGNRKAVAQGGHMHPLGQILANEFLECSVGIQGLYYDQENEEFLLSRSARDLNIVETDVSFRGDIDLEQTRQNR